jgi:hypothetical protein
MIMLCCCPCHLTYLNAFNQFEVAVVVFHQPHVCMAAGAEDALPQKSKSFRRVKSEDWIGMKGSMSNSYEDTFGRAGWGHKAQQILGQVRGKDFRHEKTKKKRGSYMGGKIDVGARCSFKYDSD